jgi:hypothetical protein
MGRISVASGPLMKFRHQLETHHEIARDSACEDRVALPRPSRSRTRQHRSRARKAGDPSAFSGEGLQPVGFDATAEFRQRSPHETEMERTADRLVGGCDLFEGAAPEHNLFSVRGSLQLGSETELFMQANELVNRVLLGDRRERGPADGRGARPKPLDRACSLPPPVHARADGSRRQVLPRAGDSTRLRILELLRDEGELSVGELVAPDDD